MVTNVEESNFPSESITALEVTETGELRDGAEGQPV